MHFNVQGPPVRPKTISAGDEALGQQLGRWLHPLGSQRLDGQAAGGDGNLRRSCIPLSVKGKHFNAATSHVCP